MSPETIVVDRLSKTYQVPEREGGFGAAVRSFFKRKYKDVKAVQQVDFKITQGEVVGFLGPNGAGKTTTLKMLSGLLHPTNGKANVLGFTPWELKPEYLRAMTLVMGQRNRLAWDIPAADSFLLNQAIYRIPDDEYKKTYQELDELLELEPIMRKPVRNLSLGERMKCEIAAGLLHRPRVLFLDEPTIGLDVVSQKTVREFLREHNARRKTTILLTSHYMADIQELCQRVIIIDKGTIFFDGALSEVLDRFADFKIITIQFASATKLDEPALARFGEVVERSDLALKLKVKRDHVITACKELLDTLPVQDIDIQEVPIEEIIRKIFAR